MNLTLSLFPLGWQHYLLGGLLVGTGTALLFVLTGRIGGMSTVFSSTWSYVVQRPFFKQARRRPFRYGNWQSEDFSWAMEPDWAMDVRPATASAAWVRCNCPH